MNIIDFEDARERGKRRGIEAARRVLDRWNRPETETAIGQIISKIKANPDLAAMQNPKALAEMEERYGEN